MNKIKDKYEVILAFVTLAISFSAFKDDLDKINLDLGYIRFALSQYFLTVVFGLTISLYLYVAEKLVRDTMLGKWKIFDYAVYLSYFLFVSIFISPVLIVLNLILFKIFAAVNNYEGITNIEEVLLAVVGIAVNVLTVFITTKTYILQSGDFGDIDHPIPDQTDHRFRRKLTM